MLTQTFVSGPFETNTYLLGCEASGNAVIIDPAEPENAIADYLTDHQLHLTHILLTHGHLDHIGGVAWLQRKYQAQIWMHAAELSILQSAPEFALFLNLPAPEIFPTPNFINEGDVICAGTLQLRVVHTPGHTPGSVCFICNDQAWVGDTLFAESIGRTDLPGGDYAQIIRSIRQKLLTLPENMVIYPGHGPASSIGVEKKYNPFFN